MHAKWSYRSKISTSNNGSTSVAALQLCRPLCQSAIITFIKDTFNAHAHAGHVIIDSGIITLSVAAAYLIRFEGVPTGADAKQFLLWLPILLAMRLLVNSARRVYRFMWRFACLSDAIALAQSLFLVTLFLIALRLFYPAHAPLSLWVRLPLSIIALEYLLSLTGCLGARAVRRIVYERRHRLPVRPGKMLKRVLLYGAGTAGIMLIRELVNHADIEIAGFVDDDPMKVGAVISGVKMLGNGESLREIISRNRVDEVVVSIAAASPKLLIRILSRCKQCSVPAKIIPSLRELLSRETSISQVREIHIGDILGRESIEVNEFDPRMRPAYACKRILVTGAGGSIGSELVRQLLFLDPHSIAILDKDENSIYELEQELKVNRSKVHIEPVIADVRNQARLFAILGEFKPEVVFHAAAHKHVPLMEKNPCEAILNNVCGTRNLLDACQQDGVERFVFISSDKAVNPTNVMGATKKLGEMLVQAYANGGPMRMACVRFGNVMGSRGSVIPLFQKQIAQGGPITITHPDIVRFFMTIPEACQLVLCAGSLANRGEIFVLDMGSPRNILDLAQQMVRLCGLEPGNDIQIEITGLRPGEKMHEELVGCSEQISPTLFEKVSMIVGRSLNDQESFFAGLGSLIRAAQRNDSHAVYDTLSVMRLGFSTCLTFREAPQHADYALTTQWKDVSPTLV